MTSADTSGRLPDAFLRPGSSSFVDFLSAHRPDLLPGHRAGLPGRDGPAAAVTMPPHATTIVAMTFGSDAADNGVVLAGDRRATQGNMIASREMEKVFPADAFSAVGIAGSAGIAVELVRLFQLELEHYEKIEGSLLSLDGKANRLATMIRGNLPMALQGLAVVPLFGGYDLERGVGRIFSYDVAGGRYEEHDHHSVGSGSVFARGALKKLWRPGLSEDEAVHAAVESLYDAADDDSATGGPDPVRRIWPVVTTVTAQGYRRVPDERLGEIADEIVAARRASHDVGRGAGSDARGGGARA